jgi:hypothetical protein
MKSPLGKIPALGRRDGVAGQRVQDLDPAAPELLDFGERVHLAALVHRTERLAPPWR